MPKSKRDKKISLTKVDKKNYAFKQKVVEDVKSCMEKFESVYVFSFVNMRNEVMKSTREEWKPSRFFFGKNKVISIGLGRTKEEEMYDGLHKFTMCMKGQCGLLFTDCTKKEVTEWFDSFKYDDFARSGFKANQHIELKQGPLKQFSHAIEPYLRQLGMPTSLERGVVTLIKDYEVCKVGTVLTPEQAKILELLDIRLATFKFTLKACFSKKDGFEKLTEEDEGIDEEMDEVAEEESEEEKPPVKKSKKAKTTKVTKKSKAKKKEESEEEMEEDD